MQQAISRREFNQAAAALSLAGLPFSSSVVTKQKSLRLQVQCGTVCADGRHLTKDDWRLEFFVRVVQREQAAPRQCRGRIMTPTDAFADRLIENGFDGVRRNPKRLVAERVTLTNSVAGLCLGLEAAFPADQQDELWTDPTPERWGEYVVPDKRVVERFWVGEART